METSRSLINRMIRAARLDSNLYEEVEADTTATKQALLAVVLVSLLSGIGSAIAGLATRGGLWFIWGLLIGLVSSIVGWLAWSFVTYLIGTKLFKTAQTSATWGELLRTIGFSNSPGVFRFFSFVPLLGGIIALAASVWSLIAGVIAVRQALDFSTGRAIGTCIVGWIVYMVIIFLVTMLLPGAGAIF